jgi:hypothetical protein
MVVGQLDHGENSRNFFSGQGRNGTPQDDHELGV